jgi:hypothetical protein
MSTSGAYQYATGEGGIGLDAMNETIRKFFAALAVAKNRVHITQPRSNNKTTIPSRQGLRH